MAVIKSRDATHAIVKARVPTVILMPNGLRSAWRVAAKEENSIVDRREDGKVNVLAT